LRVILTEGSSINPFGKPRYDIGAPVLGMALWPIDMLGVKLPKNTGSRKKNRDQTIDGDEARASRDPSFTSGVAG
jgi:hypothetical protein